MKEIDSAIEIILQARHLIAFCGAGISVESGIPPFRGENGLWNKYDADCLDLDTYLYNPQLVWLTIKEIFYDFFGEALPNPAHFALAKLEEMGLLKAVITQNIDNLHQTAGSKDVIEFHGNSHSFICQKCGKKYALKDLQLDKKPPLCGYCKGLLKPDFVFFGEAIPELARDRAFGEAEMADVVLVIGTTGEIMPACLIPRLAWQRGAKIIEINPGYSAYRNTITHIHLSGAAGIILPLLVKGLAVD
ncbi:MAG: NAD-dependent deacylase [Candidatus Cloacimonetes bacterium]|nr:NAD-dependent deacylase [Candidatus Cloacimonadota bacterium]